MAQDGPGTIAGTVTNPDGSVVATAPVELKNTGTGQTVQVVTSANGSYRFARLPDGTYDLRILPFGFMFAGYQKKGIGVRADQPVKLDIRLRWGGNLGTPGDDVTILVRSQGAAASGPAPRTAAGKPDFSGVWLGTNEADPEEPTLLPWAAAITKKRQANGAIEHPSGLCLPGDVLLTSPFLYKIVQTPAVMILLWEGNVPGADQVFLDGRGHEKALDPSWMGHSIGHWEGDTLVVDTVGFNDRSWIRLYPHTEMLHVVQRYRRPNLAHLEKEITIEDPGTFTKPWKMRAIWDLAPREEIAEYICNENEKDVPHLK